MSIEHSLNVIHYISHLIRAHKCRNTQFINSTRKEKVLLVLVNDSGQASGSNWIPMSFGLICNIQMVGIEVSSWGFKIEFQRQYDEFGGKGGAPPGQEECLMYCTRWVRGVLMVMEECRMELMGADPGHEVPTGIEERISSGAARRCWAVLKGEGSKVLGMN